MADEQPQESAVDIVPSTESKEPALSAGAVVAGATLLVNGAILFGVTISPDQKLYLVSVITFLAPLIAALWIRFKVWSPRSVEQFVQDFKIKEAAQRREVDMANARVVAAKSATDVVQASIPAVVQGLVANLVPAAPSAPVYAPADVEPLRPPSDRVYGLQEPAQGPNGTRQAPQVRQRRDPASVRWDDRAEYGGPATDPEDGYRYPDQPAPRQAPRGYGRRHRLEDPQ